MVGEHPLVGEVRGGTGLMAAVALKPELVAENPALTAQVYGAVRDEGKVLTRAMLGSLGMSPPLTITEAEIGELAKGVRTGLDAVLRSRG
jgi:adenosylmethionine-8-amino-7-oxononanoate aminotransferase